MSKKMSSYGGREGGIGGLVGGIFMRGNKSIFLRHSALPSLSLANKFSDFTHQCVSCRAVG